MKEKLIELKSLCRDWNLLILIILFAGLPTQIWGNEGKETVGRLIAMGFENIRLVDTDEERIFTLENVAYKIQEIGIAQAVETIQKYGLPESKRCKVIITHLDIPEMALTYEPIKEDSVGSTQWSASYEVAESWEKARKEEVKNSSKYKVDILIYPQFSFQNMDITKIYQVMFSLNPTVEFTLWRGMKFSGQVILPLIVDTEGYAAYSPIYKKVRPGFITLSQKFRLPYNVKGRAVVGMYNLDQYGLDLELFRPFKDERFSLQARIGYTGWAYWDGFKCKYNGQYQWTWSVGGNFYWPLYNVLFSLKAEQYLMGERGVCFEMIRHFRYASVGFYAMKAEDAKSNGGFRFQVALPPYKQKRNGYIPRITTSRNMGVKYNAGNERTYYKQYRAEASDNIMEQNRFNPIYIESEIRKK